MRLLFKFFLLPLFSVLFVGFISSHVVPLTNLGNRSMYSLEQTSYLEIVWCTSKIIKKYVDMQTIQSFHFLQPTYIVRSQMDSVRIYKKFERFLSWTIWTPPNTHVDIYWKFSNLNETSTMYSSSKLLANVWLYYALAPPIPATFNSPPKFPKKTLSIQK